MSWTVRGSTSIWFKRFSVLLIIQGLTCAHAEYAKYVARFFFFQGVVWPGRGDEHPPHTATRLSISRTISLLLHCTFIGMLREETNLHFRRKHKSNWNNSLCNFRAQRFF